MNNDVKDPAEICKAIAVDFKRRGLTHRTAGEMLGLSKQSVSNQISGKKPFSLKAAQRYADTLGYDIRFLLFGKGNLYPNIKPEVQKACSFSRKDPSPVDLRVHSKIARLLLRLLNNRDAIEAYDQDARQTDEHGYTEWLPFECRLPDEGLRGIYQGLSLTNSILFASIAP